MEIDSCATERVTRREPGLARSYTQVIYSFLGPRKRCGEYQKDKPEKERLMFYRSRKNVQKSEFYPIKKRARNSKQTRLLNPNI